MKATRKPRARANPKAGPAELRARARAARSAMTGLHEAARAHLQKTQQG